MALMLTRTDTFLDFVEIFIASVQHVFLLYTFSIKVVPFQQKVILGTIKFPICFQHVFFVLTLGDVDSGNSVGSADFTICSNIIVMQNCIYI